MQDATVGKTHILPGTIDTPVNMRSVQVGMSKRSLQKVTVHQGHPAKSALSQAYEVSEFKSKSEG